MIDHGQNPFTVTKAVDFSDEQIRDTWVDLPGEGGFPKLVNLTSPMPMLMLGGKGSGRTHIMRYFSYPLQKLRCGDRGPLEAVKRDGYLGVYLRCEGLNAGRFEGKHQVSEEWNALFPYYMDLWLAQLTLETIGDVVKGHEELGAAEPAFCTDVMSLFDATDVSGAETIISLVANLRALQREIDFAVNNVALTRSLGHIVVRSTRGRLVFGIPQAAGRHFAPLQKVLFLYLIDELENLTEAQQVYVNTLIREKQPPASFKVGARLYGMRTYLTLSGGEENREGSEFELLQLDQQLRTDPRYPHFSRLLVGRRLVQAGYDHGEVLAQLLKNVSREPDRAAALEALPAMLNALFEVVPDSPFDREATRFIEENYPPEGRPYLVRLRKSLEGFWRRGLAPGVSSDQGVAAIIDKLRVAAYPLIERTNVFLLYQAWAGQEDLRAAADRIAEESAAFVLAGGAADSKHGRVLGHFRADILAQLLREGRQQRQRYVGLDTFIAMSSGLPRLLLVVLKHVYKWAMFNGETPFAEGSRVSIATQFEAVQEASNWFFRDSRIAGGNSQQVQEGVERLGSFFRKLRFTDKPVDPSLITFSTVLAETSTGAQECIALAQKSCLLIPVYAGHKDKNTSRVVDKFQLNPMLCPRFDLPLGRRGTIALNPNEVNAIFDVAYRDEYESVVRIRADRMTAPFGRASSVTASGDALAGEGKADGNGEQRTLPGFE